MGNRRDEVLDAAIRVLGDSGIHKLTHRTIDTEAGLPVGATSNLFRTRDALLDAVVERFAELERVNWEEIAIRVAPTTPQQLAEVLTEAAHDATGRHKTLTVARYLILVESAIHPALRTQLAATGQRVNAWFLNWVRTAGSADPERHAPVIANHWTGIVLHQLAMPDPAFDPLPQITDLITALMGARTTRTRR